ncbi:peptidyl-prolyl cis-trans isomerase [Sphingomonas sp. M1A8_2b]
MMKSEAKRTGLARRLVATMALPLTLAMVSGCTKKPGGQVVAVVSDEEVTQQDLQAEAQAARIPATADKQAATSAILQRVIDRNLLASYAQEQGLDRGPEYVARRRLMEQTLLAELGMRKLAGTQSEPTPAEAQAFVAAHPTLFAQRQQLTLDQVQFPTLDDAARLKALSNLASIDAVVQQLTANGIAFTRGTPVLDTATLDPAVAGQITVLRNGEVFDISTGGQTFVSAIISRSSAANLPSAWSASAVAAIKRERLMKSVQGSMNKLRKDANIQYDPAFKPKAT